MDLPIGSIVMFTGVTLPIGWYECDGGTYVGVTTPNLIGAFPKGVPSAGTLGATGGALTHYHTNIDTGYATHNHAGVVGSTGDYLEGAVGSIWTGSSYGGVDSHTHTVTLPAVSGQASHKHTMPPTNIASSLPPNISLRYIMRCE